MQWPSLRVLLRSTFSSAGFGEDSLPILPTRSTRASKFYEDPVADGDTRTCADNCGCLSGHVALMSKFVIYSTVVTHLSVLVGFSHAPLLSSSKYSSPWKSKGYGREETTANEVYYAPRIMTSSSQEYSCEALHYCLCSYSNR